MESKLSVCVQIILFVLESPTCPCASSTMHQANDVFEATAINSVDKSVLPRCGLSMSCYSCVVRDRCSTESVIFTLVFQ